MGATLVQFKEALFEGTAVGAVTLTQYPVKGNTLLLAITSTTAAPAPSVPVQVGVSWTLISSAVSDTGLVAVRLSTYRGVAWGNTPSKTLNHTWHVPVVAAAYTLAEFEGIDSDQPTESVWVTEIISQDVPSGDVTLIPAMGTELWFEAYSKTLQAIQGVAVSHEAIGTVGRILNGEVGHAVSYMKDPDPGPAVGLFTTGAVISEGLSQMILLKTINTVDGAVAVDSYGSVAANGVLETPMVSLQRVEPSIIGSQGGDRLELIGTFPVGQEVVVRIGATGTLADAYTLTGKPGQQHSLIARNSSRLVVFAPALPAGASYSVRVDVDLLGCPNLIPPKTPDRLFIFSGHPNDNTQFITLIGLDVNGNEIVEELWLQGVTPRITVNTFSRLYLMRISASHLGTIACYRNDGGGLVATIGVGLTTPRWGDVAILTDAVSVTKPVLQSAVLTARRMFPPNLGVGPRNLDQVP